MARLFEVRNASGQFIGTWSAKNANAALKRAEQELNAGANYFRKTWSRVSLSGCVAIEICPRTQ